MSIRTFTLTDTDRTIYENIRVLLVSAGMLPDVTQYTDQEKYQKAKVALGKNLVEVYGVGAAESRNGKTTNRIVIDRKGVNVGDLASAAYVIKPKKDKDGFFQKVEIPEMTSDIDYDVRLYSNSVATERRMFECMLAAFGMRKYVPITLDYHLNDDELALVNFRGEVDMSSGELRERLLKYTVMDIWLNQNFGQDKIIRDDIPMLTSVKFQISISGLSGTKETGEKVLEVELKSENDENA